MMICREVLGNRVWRITHDRGATSRRGWKTFSICDPHHSRPDFPNPPNPDPEHAKTLARISALRAGFEVAYPHPGLWFCRREPQLRARLLPLGEYGPDTDGEFTVRYRSIKTALLATCRLLYFIAEEILYKENMLSFSDSHTFATFMENRKERQTNWIKSVRFLVTTQSQHCPEQELEFWKIRMTQKMILAMIGSREVELHVLQDGVSPQSWHRERWLAENKVVENYFDTSAFQAFYKLRMLNLDDVRVETTKHQPINPNAIDWARHMEEWLRSPDRRKWWKKVTHVRKQRSKRLREEQEIRSWHCDCDSSQSCIEARQALSDDQRGRACAPRQDIVKDCGLVHRTCQCHERQCEHSTSGDSTAIVIGGEPQPEDLEI